MTEKCRAYQRIDAGVRWTCRHIEKCVDTVHNRLHAASIPYQCMTHCSQIYGGLKVGSGIVLAVPCMTRLHWMIRQSLTYGRARPDEQQIRELGDFLIWRHKEQCTDAGSLGARTGVMPVSSSTLAPHVQVPPES